MNGRLAEENELGTMDMLLCLSVMTYFPEFSHNEYAAAGDFISDYLSRPVKERPRTMFSGFCSDERSGVTQMMERAAHFDRLTRLPIVYSSTGSDKFTSLCLAEDRYGDGGNITRRDIYVMIGCNYRFGEYVSDFGSTSTWRDNFLGAVQTDTAEQKSILRFYDEAVKAALSDERITADTAVTITVCGHSKAGNLAQYITVMRENVTRCVSFDGQGFSAGFIRKYRSLAEKSGKKIISICPDMSIAGSLLRPIPGAKRIYLKTPFLREKNAHILPLYYHIPVSLMDKTGRMIRTRSAAEPLSRMLYRVSVIPAAAASLLPFIDDEKALDGLGKALMHYFKGSPRKALISLMNKDTQLLLSLGALTFGALAPITILETVLAHKKRR